MKKHFLKLSLIAAIALTFNSCAPSAVVVRTRPVTPVYVRPLPPGPSHVWVDGEWVLRGNQYYYNQGYWAKPKHRNAYWVSGHWKNARGGSYWVPGRWK